MVSKYRTRILVASLTALALGMAGCSSSSSSSSGSAASSSSQQLQTVNLLLQFTPNPSDAPIAWGEAQGIFAKQGIKLNILSSNGSSVSVPEVAENKVAFAFGDYNVYLADYLKGETGATAVEVYQPIPITGIVAPVAITNLHQLVGKSFGDVAGSSGIPELDYILKKNGIDPSSVPLKLLSYSVLYPEFYQGKIYAAELDEPGDESAMAQAQASHVPAVYTPLSNFGLKGFATVLMASNQEIKNDPALVRKMATAIYESEAQAVAQATDSAIVTDYQKLVPTATAADILPAWHDYKTQEIGFGRFDPATVQTILTQIQQMDNVTATSPASDLYSNAYLPANAG